MQSPNTRIGQIIVRAIPADKVPRFTPEQIEKLKTAGGITLVILGVAGTIALSVIAPNIFWAVDKVFFSKSKNRRFSKKEKTRKISRTFYYLKEQGYIRMRSLGGKDFIIQLTKLGRKRLKKMNFFNLTIPKPLSWNGKWWQIAADIPTEDYKWAADLFREKLLEMKFYPLQRTLWFYPHDPRAEVGFILEHYGIGRFVTIMEINRLDKSDEGKIKKFFQKERIL